MTRMPLNFESNKTRSPWNTNISLSWDSNIEETTINFLPKEESWQQRFEIDKETCKDLLLSSNIFWKQFEDINNPMLRRGNGSLCHTVVTN